MLDLPNNILELINAFAFVVRFAIDVLRPKVPPLEAVDGAEIAFLSMG